MSRSFAGVQFITYRPVGAGDAGGDGTSTTLLNPFPVQDTTLCMPSTRPSRIIALRFNWAQALLNAAGATSGNLGIEVVIPNQSSDKLGKISSLYIDNTGSTVPIYVNFPDTGFVITAPPFTAVWYPVYTNMFRFQVICLSMVTGFAPTTRIFVSNREIGPSSDPEIQKVFPQLVGSTNTQFGAANSVTPGFGPPALGDRMATQQSLITTVLTAGGFTVTDLNNLTGFIYITGINVYFDFFSGVISTAGSILWMAFNFGDSVGNFMMRGSIAAQRAADAAPVVVNTTALNMQGLNLRYPAANFPFVIGTNAPGVSAGTITSVAWRATANISYSNNPN